MGKTRQREGGYAASLTVDNPVHGGLGLVRPHLLGEEPQGSLVLLIRVLLPRHEGLPVVLLLAQCAEAGVNVLLAVGGGGREGRERGGGARVCPRVGAEKKGGGQGGTVFSPYTQGLKCLR